VLGMDRPPTGRASGPGSAWSPGGHPGLELTVLDNLMIYGRYFDLARKVIRQRADLLLEFANSPSGPTTGSSHSPAA